MTSWKKQCSVSTSRVVGCVSIICGSGGVRLQLSACAKRLKSGFFSFFASSGLGTRIRVLLFCQLLLQMQAVGAKLSHIHWLILSSNTNCMYVFNCPFHGWYRLSAVNLTSSPAALQRSIINIPLTYTCTRKILFYHFHWNWIYLVHWNHCSSWYSGNWTSSKQPSVLY